MIESHNSARIQSKTDLRKDSQRGPAQRWKWMIRHSAAAATFSVAEIEITCCHGGCVSCRRRSTREYLRALSRKVRWCLTEITWRISRYFRSQNVFFLFCMFICFFEVHSNSENLPGKRGLVQKCHLDRNLQATLQKSNTEEELHAAEEDLTTTKKARSSREQSLR